MDTVTGSAVNYLKDRPLEVWPFHWLKSDKKWSVRQANKYTWNVAGVCVTAPIQYNDVKHKL